MRAACILCGDTCDLLGSNTIEDEGWCRACIAPATRGVISCEKIEATTFNGRVMPGVLEAIAVSLMNTTPPILDMDNHPSCCTDPLEKARATPPGIALRDWAIMGNWNEQLLRQLMTCWLKLCPTEDHDELHTAILCYAYGIEGAEEAIRRCTKDSGLAHYPYYFSPSSFSPCAIAQCPIGPLHPHPWPRWRKDIHLCDSECPIYKWAGEQFPLWQGRWDG